MSVRFAGAQKLERSTNIPDEAAMTLCCWARRRVDTNNYAMVMGVYEASGGTGCSLTTAVNGDDLQLWNEDSVAVTLKTGLVNDTWFFCAMVGQGNGASDLIGYYAEIGDASLTSVTNDNVDATTANRVAVGDNGVSSIFWNGSVVAVKIWDAALTESELNWERWFWNPVRLDNINTWSMLNSTTDELVDYSGVGGNWTKTGTLTNETNPPLLWHKHALKRSSFAQPVYDPATGFPWPLPDQPYPYLREVVPY